MDNDHTIFADRKAQSCEEIEEQLDRYLDCEMEESEQKGFESHLEHCDFCRCLVDDCEKLVRTARSLADLPVPPEVSNRLRQRLEQELGFKFSAAKPRLYLIK